jgi:hypothetical protein
LARRRVLTAILTARRQRRQNRFTFLALSCFSEQKRDRGARHFFVSIRDALNHVGAPFEKNAVSSLARSIALRESVRVSLRTEENVSVSSILGEVTNTLDSQDGSPITPSLFSWLVARHHRWAQWRGQACSGHTVYPIPTG